MRRHLLSIAAFAFALLPLSCREAPPLDATSAERIIRSRIFEREPVYAEVPMRIRWGPAYPMDEFDERSLSTLEKLQSAGLITLSREEEDGMSLVTATTTRRGFRELGTVPSARGPALRGRIAEKVVEEIRNFETHPSQPRVGRAEIVWRYQSPTELYELFDTKQDKPIDEPFVSVVSITHGERGWSVETIVPRMRTRERGLVESD
jgi:hypothetical protein